jgi:hypothetical protein
MEEAVKETTEEAVKDAGLPPEPKFSERWFWAVGWFSTDLLTFKTFTIEKELVI